MELELETERGREREKERLNVVSAWTSLQNYAGWHRSQIQPFWSVLTETTCLRAAAHMCRQNVCDCAQCDEGEEWCGNPELLTICKTIYDTQHKYVRKQFNELKLVKDPRHALCT